MSAADFWALTLREFDEMLEAYQAKLRREFDTPAALIASTLANINRDVEKHPEPFSLEEFLLRSPEELAELHDPDAVAAAESAKIEHQARWISELFAGPGPLARKAKT